MKFLIDTNVVLDYFLRREPFYADSSKVILLSEKEYIEGFVSASSVTDIFYIAERNLKDSGIVRKMLEKLLKTIRVAAVGEKTIHEALDLKWKDFEDSVQYSTAQGIWVDYIITRDSKHFNDSQIKAISPKELLDLITNAKV
ncbi:MAG: PIN domain-containing protein [Oscillospiraceae bacterium]|nr:PIN domain-containing protein [Oscillospiraceae bacterium]